MSKISLLVELAYDKCATSLHSTCHSRSVNLPQEYSSVSGALSKTLEAPLAHRTSRASSASRTGTSSSVGCLPQAALTIIFYLPGAGCPDQCAQKSTPAILKQMNNRVELFTNSNIYTRNDGHLES